MVRFIGSVLKRWHGVFETARYHSQMARSFKGFVCVADVLATIPEQCKATTISNACSTMSSQKCFIDGMWFFGSVQNGFVFFRYKVETEHPSPGMDVLTAVPPWRVS